MNPLFYKESEFLTFIRHEVKKRDYKYLTKLPEEGAMGLVFVIFHRINLSNRVLKIYKVPEDSLEDQFRQSTTKLLEYDHPNIVKIFDTGTWQYNDITIRYSIQEYFPSKSFAEISRKILQEKTFVIRLHLALDLTHAVKALRERYTIHGDLHPGNVLIDTDHDVLKVIDPGFSRQPSPDVDSDMENFQYILQERLFSEEEARNPEVESIFSCETFTRAEECLETLIMELVPEQTPPNVEEALQIFNELINNYRETQAEHDIQQDSSKKLHTLFSSGEPIPQPKIGKKEEKFKPLPTSVRAQFSILFVLLFFGIDILFVILLFSFQHPSNNMFFLLSFPIILLGIGFFVKFLRLGIIIEFLFGISFCSNGLFLWLYLTAQESQSLPVHIGIFLLGFFSTIMLIYQTDFFVRSRYSRKIPLFLLVVTFSGISLLFSEKSINFWGILQSIPLLTNGFSILLQLLYYIRFLPKRLGNKRRVSFAIMGGILYVCYLFLVLVVPSLLVYNLGIIFMLFLFSATWDGKHFFSRSLFFNHLIVIDGFGGFALYRYDIDELLPKENNILAGMIQAINTMMNEIFKGKIQEVFLDSGCLMLEEDVNSNFLFAMMAPHPTPILWSLLRVFIQEFTHQFPEGRGKLDEVAIFPIADDISVRLFPSNIHY